MNPRVGYATVYRTLKLLKECGLAAERHFDDGQARYEPAEEAEQHHDHIICERCGKIVEFNSEELEKLQERIAPLPRLRREPPPHGALRHLCGVPRGAAERGRDATGRPPALTIASHGRRSNLAIT